MVGGRADGFRKITFWFCSICRREIIRSRPPSLLPNTFFQIVPTSTLRYLEHSIRAYGIVAVFFVAKFDGKGREGYPRSTTARLNGSRENAREIDCPLSLSLSLSSFLAYSLCRCGLPTYSNSNGRLLKENDSRIAK